jgi:hypothetical protein
LFESGQYEIDESKDIDEINKIKYFINNNKGKKLLVKISASHKKTGCWALTQHPVFLL